MKKAGIPVSRTLIFVFAFAFALSPLSAVDAGPTPPTDAVRRAGDELLASPPEGLTRADVALALGWLHLFDMLGVPDSGRAVRFLKLALDEGLPEAGVILGAIYIGQEDVAATVRDVPLALSYYEKAATGGSVDAMRMLGVLYADGHEGVEPDPEKSRRYLLAAAARGSEMALRRFAPPADRATGGKREQSSAGEAPPLPLRDDLVDPVLAEEARQRAAKVAETTARVHDMLVARLDGEEAEALSRAGVDAVRNGRNDVWAKVEKAVEDGAMEIIDAQPDDRKKGEAALIIGVLHYMGLLHGQDPAKARHFLELALGYGIPEARVTLGELHIGLTRDEAAAERDVAKGMAYLEAAAGEDSVDALRLLGMLYADGVEGVPADAARSEEYFLAAARHGDSESLEKLSPLFARAAEWEREHPGEKSPLPTGPEAVIVPELAEKARLRGEEINAMVEHVNAELGKKVTRTLGLVHCQYYNRAMYFAYLYINNNDRYI